MAVPRRANLPGLLGSLDGKTYRGEAAMSARELIESGVEKLEQRRLRGFADFRQFSELV